MIIIKLFSLMIIKYQLSYWFASWYFVASWPVIASWWCWHSDFQLVHMRQAPVEFVGSELRRHSPVFLMDHPPFGASNFSSEAEKHPPRVVETTKAAQMVICQSAVPQNMHTWEVFDLLWWNLARKRSIVQFSLSKNIFAVCSNYLCTGVVL